MRLINKAMGLLGFSKGSAHGVRRAIYLFPLATNLENVIQKNEEPLWIARNVESVTDYWKVKWATPRSEKRKEYLDFFKDKFINDTIEELKKI